VQCAFQSRVLCPSAVDTDGMVVASRNLEYAKNLSILNGE
jgi:hypothetical protein